MIPLFLDFETTFTKDITLKKMSLRRYLAAADITMLCVRYEGESYVIRPHELSAYTPTLAELFMRDDVVVVAHNTAFDLRVAKYKLGLPYPKHSLCTLELSLAAWPGVFQSYALGELAKEIPGLPQKIEIDLTTCTDAELEAYCLRDVEVCEALYYRTIQRVPQIEQDVIEMTGAVRDLSITIDQAKATVSLDAFTKLIKASSDDALAKLGAEPTDYAAVFGLDGVNLKSVKAAGVKNLLLENLGFRTSTISSKKISPENLRRNPAAADALDSIKQTNSALSMSRNVRKLTHDDEVDLNLTAWGSVTGRWTGTGTGKGVNFLNLPKHNAVIAKPMRQMLTVKDRLLVRADAANLEYRMIGWWTKCKHIEAMFTKDVFANPYIAFGLEVTGKVCTKKEPAYKVWKAACLGLGFGMGAPTFAVQLAQQLARAAVEAQATGKPASLTLQDFQNICDANLWRLAPRDLQYLKSKGGELPDAVLIVAHKTHEKFHVIHPELKRTADWIIGLANSVSASSDPEHAIAKWLDQPHALDPERLRFAVDPGYGDRSLVLTCGPWVPSLRWSCLKVAAGKYGMQLCHRSPRSPGGVKGITKQLVLENPTQAMGRNAMAYGMLKLWSDGWPAPLNVHDEVLLAVPEDLSAIVRARDAIQDTFKPGGYVAQKFDWACIVDPKEITVSRTMWDASPDDICPNLWDRIAAGDKSILALLP